MPSEVLYNPGTSVVFKASGGDVTFTPTSVANGNARVSAQWDRGSGAKPGLYRWFAKTRVNSSVSVGKSANVYLAQAKDATDIPGRLGTSDASITSSASDRMRNLTAVGSINADTTSTSDDILASGTVEIYARYVTVVWLNLFGVTLSATDGHHYFELQPIPPQSQ